MVSTFDMLAMTKSLPVVEKEIKAERKEKKERKERKERKGGKDKKSRHTVDDKKMSDCTDLPKIKMEKSTEQKKIKRILEKLVRKNVHVVGSFRDLDQARLFLKAYKSLESGTATVYVNERVKHPLAAPFVEH